MGAVTMTNNDRDEFREVLDELERVLLVPLVAGELTTWSETALQAFQAAAPVLRRRIETLHAEEIREIRHDDPELSAKAEELAATDRELLAGLDRLGAVLGKLFDVAPGVEPNEAPAASVLERISAQGVEFVVAMLRQEEAIKLWRHESLARDRGNAD